MHTYKTSLFGIQRNDGAFIPKDIENTDYLAYLAWVDAGGVPEGSEESND